MIKALLADREVGRRVRLLFLGLVLLLLVINGLNVVNSYVGRDFMTALEQRNRNEFALQALIYVGVFAASTVASVLSRFTEESLGLVSRTWLSWRALRRYASHRVYFRLAENRKVGNPDQRIAEDIRAFTATTLSFFLMLINGILTVLAFSGVLWHISPTLFAVAILYASAGTYLSYRLGRPLVRLNHDQSDKEANFRAALIQLCENTNPVALSRREGELALKAQRNLTDLAENFQRIIQTNRNLGFCTTGYNWLAQIIPALVVAPLFIDGDAEFGVITQAAIAFTQLLGAFSLIVTQFQSLSSFAAVITRIAVLTEAGISATEAEIRQSAAATETWKNHRRVAYREVTLRSHRSQRLLIEDLTIAIPEGKRTLVCGPDATAREALFRATAGLWPVVSGEVIRPPLDRILFVPERPFLCPGSLREIFLRPRADVNPDDALAVAPLELRELQLPDDRIVAALAAVGLPDMPDRFGGLANEIDWSSQLSLSEQQLVVLARALAVGPQFVFLDRPDTTLEPHQLECILELLTQESIGVVVFPEAPTNRERYDAWLELAPGGRWRSSFESHEH